VERTLTDEFGSMTVRVITYEFGSPPEQGSIPQLVRFCVVGGSGYALNLGVFRAADGLMPYVPAFAIAFVLSAFSNFVWNRLWTFRGAEGRPHHQLARFLTVSAAALALDLALLSGLVELAGVGKLLAAASAILLVTPLSFLGNKHWSFGRG
jgi:putative flippase GtrA